MRFGSPGADNAELGPRCDWRIDKCKTDAPPLELKAEKHWAACWRNPLVDERTIMREEVAGAEIAGTQI